MYLIAFLLSFYYVFFPYKDIDPEIKPYVDDFHVKLWERCNEEQYYSTHQISIKFGGTDNVFTEGAIGWCAKKPLGFDIVIDRDFWDKVPSTSKRTLIYHELLHCYLGYDHVENTILNDSFIYYPDHIVEEQLTFFIEQKCKP
jgi:hypothetical protein